MNPEAIEAAAKVMWHQRPMKRNEDGSPAPFSEAHTPYGARYRGQAAAALEAAAPYLLAAAWDEGFKRGTLDQFEDSENPYRKASV